MTIRARIGRRRTWLRLPLGSESGVHARLKLGRMGMFRGFAEPRLGKRMVSTPFFASAWTASKSTSLETMTCRRNGPNLPPGIGGSVPGCLRAA